MRRMRTILPGLIVGCIFLGHVRADEVDPLADKGTLDDVAEKTAELLKFGWDAGRLQLEWEKDHNQVSNKLTQISSAAGGSSSGSSSSSGGSRYSSSFRRDTLEGEVQVYTPEKEAATIQVVLREKNDPQRSIHVHDAGDGRLRIGVVGESAGYRLRLSQKEDGSVIVQELRGPRTFAAREDSFSTFLARHHEFSTQTLLPLLKKLGIALPEDRIDPDIRAAILAQLTVPADADRKAWDELLARLDADDFAARESATSELAESFERFRPLILAAAQGDEASVEAKSRLLEIIKLKHGETGRANDEWIARLGLSEDPLVLASLMESADDREHATLLAALRNVSGEDFGDDAQAWNNWAAKRTPKHDPASAEFDPLKSDGELSNIAAQTKKMIKIGLKSDRLRLDRGHWKEPFGGKSIEDLEQEIDAEIRRRGFPENWYRRNTYGSSNVEHVDVLFAHIIGAVGASMRSWGGGGSSRTMQAESETFSAKLSVSQAAGLLKPFTSSRFELYLGEKTDRPRSLDVVSDGGNLRITITDDSSDYLLHLAQYAKGPLLVQELRGLGTFSAKEDSYEALHENHAEFVQDSLLPVLDHFGVLMPGDTDSTDKPADGKADAPVAKP